MPSMLNLYFHSLLVEKSLIAEEILTFIKLSLLEDDNGIELDELKIDTDLVFFGIESIKILSLLAEIEDKFNLSLNLENLEACEFKISAVTIAESFNE